MPACSVRTALLAACLALATAAVASPHRTVHRESPAQAARRAAAVMAELRPVTPPAHNGSHWGYSGEHGPEHWGEVAEAFKLCTTGHLQSPIDLGGAEIVGRFAVTASYHPGPLTILNNGHTVQVNVPEGSLLTSGIARYKLLQVHFHTPSEEQIYGIPYPMAAHFVHVDASGTLAVLAVLFEEGAHNPELDKVIRAAPRGEESAHVVAGVTFDPGKLLPANLAVYRYEGSLTTPPCTEGVRWHVARQRVSASAGQIAAIHALIGDNARPIQPLYGRLLVAGAD